MCEKKFLGRKVTLFFFPFTYTTCFSFNPAFILHKNSTEEIIFEPFPVNFISFHNCLQSVKVDEQCYTISRET